MALEILYGKHFNKKDDTVFSRIKECIEKEEAVLYIVPEQYSFTADKTLLEALGEQYTHLTETVNFKRLALMVNKQFQPEHRDYIDEETKSLILYKIIQENTSCLSTVKNRKNNPDSVLLFKNILSECKGHLIEHDVLEQIKGKLEEKTLLYQKIHDLDFLMTKYQKEISEKFKDFEDSFQTLAQYIEEKQLYQNYKIFIDNFINFSPSEYMVIKALLKNAASLTVTLLIDDFSKKEPGDLFYPSYETYSQLAKLAEKTNKNILFSLLPNSEEEMYIPFFEGTSEKPNLPGTTLTIAKNQKDEVRLVVESIKKLVSQGASYSDFTVLTGNLNLYADEIETAFLISDIPCFLDRKSPLTKNPLAKIFLNLFSMILSDYRKDSVIEYLKSLCCIYNAYDEICVFEELLERFSFHKNDLSSEKNWNQKCEFLQTQDNFFSKKLDMLKSVYRRFLLPVINHFSKKGEYLNAFLEYAKELQLENYVKNFLETKEAVFRKDTVNSYNTILNAIRKIDLLFSDKSLNMAEYYTLFKQSMELYESGEIPDTLDTVTVSDVERGRTLSVPYVFILGMNENITPKSNTNTTYLSDFERESIEELTGISLPTALRQNCDSVLLLYRAFLSAENCLFLSSAETADDKTPLMPCYLWNQLTKVIPVTKFQSEYVNLPEYYQKAVTYYQNPYKQHPKPNKIPSDFFESEEKQELKNLFTEISEMENLNYYSQSKKLSKAMLSTHYQKKLNTSVSRLESYQKCAYAYFMNYILKVSERENVHYDFRKTGSIIHSLFEKFSKLLKQHQLTWESVTDEFIEYQLDTLIPKEILRLFPELSLFNPRTKYLIKKIKRMMKSAVSYIREHFLKGEFVPMGYEIPLGEDGIPPITIALEDGSVMQLFGVIDRCDAARQNDCLYVRIIDYKSSAKEFNFALIKAGIQLQLLTYLRTVTKNGGEYLDFNGNILPGAAFYTSFGDALIPFSEKPGLDEVEVQIRKKFSMQGLVLNDDSLIRAIDKQLAELPSYQSEVCEIKTDKNGGFKLKNLLFLEEFNRLLNDCEAMLAEIGNQIMSGDISLKPYRYGKETGCDYCSYGAICMFDKKTHRFRTVSKLSKDEYFSNEQKDGEK